MKLNYFNFKELDEKMLLTNDLGKYVFVEKAEFREILSKEFHQNADLKNRLIDSAMVFDDSDLHFSEIHEYALRCAKSHLATATSLHIFVVTTACNMNCIYCQANSGTTVPNCYMSIETAERAVDIALQSPEIKLSFEFQGGEPLLNFPIIRHIVERAECNKNEHEIEYNLVSNLTTITDEMLDFFEEYHFSISTSLDGMEAVHNKNRPFRDGCGTYGYVLNGIELVKKRGMHIGAIQTTTRFSFGCERQLIQTYVDLGFDSIFIRHLTQLGKANKGWNEMGYSAEEFLESYRRILDELISLNKRGVYMREQHASIFLKRINGQRMNYMELRSPCGGGIGQLAYFTDGRVFTCDEGRMLAEMGVDAFELGDVYEGSYQSLVKSKSCHAVCAASMLETIPSCCDCVYQPYCGTCPVVSYAINGDIIEKQPRSFRCKVYSGMLDYIFRLLSKNEAETVSILDSWSR